MIDKRVNVQASFNDDFCSLLEYHLCEAFANSEDKVLKYIRCDGVDEPRISEQFTIKNITNLHEIATGAWVGEDGNSRYQMIIKLGRYSRRRALRGVDLESCLPDVGSLDHIDIDLVNCLIMVQLD